MRKGQSLVEASVFMLLVSIILLGVMGVVSRANDSQDRVMRVVSMYSGRLLATKGDPSLWNCRYGMWETEEASISLPLILEPQNIGINPMACLLGFRPPRATCVDYYSSDDRRLFSLPCEAMEANIVNVWGNHLWGQVSITGGPEIYQVVVTRQIEGKTFRHSIFVSVSDR